MAVGPSRPGNGGAKRKASDSRGIRAAMTTEPQELESYRGYLAVLARGRIPTEMQARLDASDIVQETLLEAHRKWDQYRGGADRGRLAAWLRSLLACNLLDRIRTEKRSRRDVRRERAMADALEASSLRLIELAAVADSTPSLKVSFDEQVAQVADWLEGLPATQREALRLRYCESLPVAQIAETMGTTPQAVAGLLKRGLAKLRSAAETAGELPENRSPGETE